jgi:hypothetical protein
MVCHGSTGTGADTNVLDGVYLDRDTVTESPAEGTANRGLRGGGFVNALMDTNWDNTASSASTTSAHTRDGSAGTLWGNGAIGSGAGPANFSLSCANCHDPHGTGAYRILRKIPTGSGATAGVDVPDPTAKVYSVEDTALKSGNQYFGEAYGNIGDPLSQWCSQCHTRYLTSTGSGHTASGDAIFAYRHMSNGQGCGCHGDMHNFIPQPTGGPFRHERLFCVTCHVAHGSSASMGAYGGGVRWPDGAAIPNGDNRSSLLRVDNRGVCQLCHGK